mgnify:CR=1 FL=1
MPIPAVSIFTPTYNRSHVLGRAYQSLCRQTCLDFEWVVADDGSTDDTEALVCSWIPAAPFPIRYLRFPHRGKPYAMRDGFAECRGEYLYELDSDDELAPTAVERGLSIWASLDCPEQYHDVNGWGWVPETGRPTGLPFPENMNCFSKRRQRHLCFKLGKGAGLCGEQRSFRRTAHCQSYPFPIPDGLTFIPENVLWNRIYCDYKRFYTNDRFMIYHQAEQADSLLANTRRDARPAYHYYIYHFNEIFPHDKSFHGKEYLLAAAGLCYAAARCGYSVSHLLRDVRPWPAKALCTLGWPVMALYHIFRP